MTSGLSCDLVLAVLAIEDIRRDLDAFVQASAHACQRTAQRRFPRRQEIPMGLLLSVWFAWSASIAWAEVRAAANCPLIISSLFCLDIMAEPKPPYSNTAAISNC